VVEADSGAMGGTGSQEFMVSTDAGEDLIASSSSGYAANVEKATSKLRAGRGPRTHRRWIAELVHTPNQKTIDEVGAFLGVERVYQMKTMAYMVEHADSDEKQIKTVGKTRAVVVFLRGDHQLNETKLAAIAGAELRPMQAEEIVATFNAPAGFLGPIGSLPRRTQEAGTLVILDKALEGRTNLIAGANKEEYHLRNVTPMRDFKPTLVPTFAASTRVSLIPSEASRCASPRRSRLPHLQAGIQYRSRWRIGAEPRRQGDDSIMGSYGIGIERHPDGGNRAVGGEVRRAECE